MILFKVIKYLFFSGISFLFGTFCLTTLTNCEKNYNIKAKQSSYKIVKANLQNNPCKTSIVEFKERKNEIFLTRASFLQLITNINNLKICKADLYERALTSLNYYEKIIKTLGGELE